MAPNDKEEYDFRENIVKDERPEKEIREDEIPPFVPGANHIKEILSLIRLN